MSWPDHFALGRLVSFWTSLFLAWYLLQGALGAVIAMCVRFFLCLVDAFAGHRALNSLNLNERAWHLCHGIDLPLWSLRWVHEISCAKVMSTASRAFSWSPYIYNSWKKYCWRYTDTAIFECFNTLQSLDIRPGLKGSKLKGLIHPRRPCTMLLPQM